MADSFSCTFAARVTTDDVWATLVRGPAVSAAELQRVSTACVPVNQKGSRSGERGWQGVERGETKLPIRMEISPSSAPARHPIPTRFLSSQISFVLSCSTATRWEEPLVAGGSSAAHKVKPPPPPRLLVELVEPSSQSHAPIASRVLHAPANSSQEEPAQHRRGPCRRREELVVELHPSCTSSMRRALQVRVVLAEQEAPTGDGEAATPRPSKRIPVLCTHLVGWSSFSPPWTAPDEDGEQRRTCAAQVLL